MGSITNKKGVFTTNRGHHYPMQFTSPGEPLNNHAPRRGTKRKAGGGCRCEMCVGGKAQAVEKVLDREFKKEKEDLDKD